MLAAYTIVATPKGCWANHWNNDGMKWSITNFLHQCLSTYHSTAARVLTNTNSIRASTRTSTGTVLIEYFIGTLAMPE